MSREKAQLALLALDANEHTDLKRILEDMVIEASNEDAPVKFNHEVNCLIEAITGFKCGTPDHDKIETLVEDVIKHFNKEKLRVSEVHEYVMNMSIPLNQKLFVIMNFGKFVGSKEADQQLQEGVGILQMIINEELKRRNIVLEGRSPITDVAEVLKLSMRDPAELLAEMIDKFKKTSK